MKMKNVTNRNQPPCFPYEKMQLRACACSVRPRLQMLIGGMAEPHDLDLYKSERHRRKDKLFSKQH